MIDLQAIRNATDLRQLVLYAGIKLNSNGRGKCPFCKSPGTRNFSLGGKAGGNQFFTHCCRIGGDAFTFVQKLDSCDLPTAVRRLAADAGITIDNKPETPQERRQREQDKLERSMADWYWREKWKEARRGLDRAMRAMERGNQFAEDLAGIYGARLRWIERERGTSAGMAEFRKAGVTERRYREWVSSDLRRFAARLEFVALVLSLPRQ